MEINKIKAIIANELTGPRYEHSLRVAEVADYLAKKWHADEKNIQIAALFHDMYKDKTPDQLKELLQRYQLPTSLLHYHSELWHGPVAAAAVKYKYGIKNEDIYHAIYYHTTARSSMSLTEKIVYLADYIEPNRQFPGLDRVREIAPININQALAMALSNTVHYLQMKQMPVHPDTLAAKEYYDQEGSE